VIEANQAVDDLLLNRSGDGVYRDKARMHRMLRKLLALPLLPAEHVHPAFAVISSAGVPDEAAVDQQYLSYVSATWLQSTVWLADNLSVYGQHVCTNNDVEGESDMARHKNKWSVWWAVGHLVVNYLSNRL